MEAIKIISHTEVYQLVTRTYVLACGTNTIRAMTRYLKDYFVDHFLKCQLLQNKRESSVIGIETFLGDQDNSRSLMAIEESARDSAKSL